MCCQISADSVHGGATSGSESGGTVDGRVAVKPSESKCVGKVRWLRKSSKAVVDGCIKDTFAQRKGN